MPCSEVTEADIPDPGFYQRLFVATPDLLLVVRDDGTILAANPAVEAATGFSLPELLRHRFSELLEVPEYTSTLEVFRRVLGSNRPERLQLRFASNGGGLWIDCHVNAFSKDTFLLSGRDRTADVRFANDARPDYAVERLPESGARSLPVALPQQQQELISALFEATGAAMLLLNREGRVLRLNEAAQRLCGYSPQRMAECCVWERLLPDAGLSEACAWFRLLLKRHEPIAFTNDIVTQDGMTRSVTWSSTVILDPAGEVEHVVLAGIDVTDLRQTRQQLEEVTEHFRRLLRLSFDCVVTVVDGRLAEANLMAATLLGAESPEAVMGLPVADIIAPECLPQFTERARRLFGGETTLPPVEYRLRRLDGQFLDVELVSVLTSHDGKPAALSVARDITLRKREERELREREQQFQSLAKAAPVGIFRGNLDGAYTYINERYLEITGFGYRESLGMGWQEHLHPADTERVLLKWQSMLHEGIPFRAEYRLTRHDGCVTWVLGQAIIEQDAAGQSIGCIGSITDITRSKLTEFELQRYRLKLEQMVAQRTEELAVVNHELESFSYSVSHDLRAPLRAINGFHSALLEDYGDKLDEQAMYYLRRIGVNSTQMAELVDELLELSKVNQLKLEPGRIDITSLAESVVGELRLDEPYRNVTVAIAPGLSACGDVRLLRCLLHNLLGNAWKYTRKNPQARIELGTRSVSGTEVFYIKDNGVGFDMECADNLFRAFQRLHHPSEFEGSGIGLATVQRIINRHGGRVWAEGEEGRGATFFFVLNDPPTCSSGTTSPGLHLT